MATPSSSAAPGWRRRLVRHVVRGLLVLAVLAGPNLYFFGRWFTANTPLPPVPPAVSQQADDALPPALGTAFAEALRASRERAGLPSMSVAIAWDGRVQWAGAHGFADIERAVAATPSSRYRTGSVAKPVTAVLAMQLAQSGALDLDAPVSTWLPALPAHVGTVTARQLASHRAGIRHYSRVPAWWWGWHESMSRHAYPDVQSGLAMFVDDPLRFAPGTGFEYSTFGYSLLSRVLEAAGGADFPSLLAERVFAPAGMSGTAVDAAGALPERVAFYHAKDGRWSPAWPIDSSYKIAGGGLVSTPRDLVRFGVAVLDGTLLPADARAAMFTRQPLADGTMNPENYALGWRVDDSVRLLGPDRPVPILHHGGTQPGAAAFLVLLPEHGIVVAAMSNSGTAAARAEAQEATYALARLAIAHRADAAGVPSTDAPAATGVAAR